MKVALLIVTFNRLNYLKECFWGIEHADLSPIDTIMVIDNNSDNETVNFIERSSIVRFNDSYMHFSRNKERRGISANLLQGYEYLFNKGFDVVINLDSDALVRPDCFTRLWKLYKPGQLLTGFHSTTKNANGTDRHIIRSEHDGYCIKDSVGGINFVVDRYCYDNYVKPALLATNPHGNFDHVSCLNAGGVMCAVPSLLQHIGIESSLNHHENPDVADDFRYWQLPQVTLLGVDSNKERLEAAKEKCVEQIQFGAVVLLHPAIISKEEYSRFIIYESYKYVNTSHVLIFQHDGFVRNWKSWDSGWLQYDYIGAPWWYNDGLDVGNGGFSLRSRRLMEIVATDPFIKELHPEDHVICRVYRRYLETKYNIKFAPVEAAEKFSFEGFRLPNKYLKDQFGSHGMNPRTKPLLARSEKFVINQFQGLGDILFLVPLVRDLIREGHEVIWPIADHYFNIAKHFPDLDMRLKSTLELPYDSRSPIKTAFGTLLPYRFASENMHRPYTMCMQSKYQIYGPRDYLMWRELSYQRDYKNEGKLKEMLLTGVGEYQVVNIYLGEAARGATIVPKPNPALAVVEMRTIEGFSLIDWLGVIEGAKEVHTANTSILYLLELLELTMPVYVYKRRIMGEIGFEHTAGLWTNKNLIFEK